MRAERGTRPGGLPDWPTILADAVRKPGVISAAYTAFWNYSAGNQLLAWFQCAERKIEPGPINTFRGWLQFRRHVRRGERALTLCMPVTVKRKRDPTTVEPSAGDGAERPPAIVSFTRFTYRANWFVLAQTDGAEYVPTRLPHWAEEEALARLNIERVPFRHPDGNAQGYAAGRQVAISPVAFLPHRTLLHELAHVVLGHTEELRGLADGDERTPRDIREVEAECVALVCCESLGLAGAEFSRGYIQHWLSGNPIPERSAQRIFKAADSILRAGYSGADGAPAEDGA